MAKLALETVVKGIIVLVVIGFVIFGGFQIAKPLADALTGKGQLSDQEIAQSQDVFDLFVQQYKECKSSPDTECLCSLSVVLPSDAVLRIENNQILKETEFNLIPGTVETTSPVSGISTASDVVEYKPSSNAEPLTDKKRSDRIVSGDIPYFSSDSWSVENGRLNPGDIGFSQVAYIAEGESCNPCLYAQASVPGFQVKSFGPGYLYKVDNERSILLSGNRHSGAVIMPASDELAKLKTCSLVVPEAVELYDALVEEVGSCLPVKPLATDYVSEEIRVVVGVDVDAGLFASETHIAGLRYSLSKFGKSSWALTDYYSVKDSFFGKGTFVSPLITVSSEHKQSAERVLKNLEGKNLKVGLDILQGTISDLPIALAQGEQREINPPEARPLQLMMSIEDSVERNPQVTQPTLCASYSLLRPSTRQTKVPENYALSVSSGEISLQKRGNPVKSSGELAKFCELSSTTIPSSPGAAASVTTTEETASLQFYRYLDDSVCVLPVTISEAEGIVTDIILSQTDPAKDPFAS